ncbi:hypothetical protein M407DRAFT_33397 [Tulasnella calospora MUT 4182]|uniref:Agglutinin C-terminal domain-containing protein n=1 Tax=Tulasnella calospora MUT 4182 TaxID=1051891 RepID=A0A0C3Q2E9_9AGAM|nr:hypothetical protein M407DRAFT_33397 [Tulasnella calospora MUT 4182]
MTPSDGAEVTCSQAAVEMDHQLWTLDRVSRTGSETKAIFESWKPDVGGRITQPHATQTELPPELRPSLWKDAKLIERPVRPGIFDYNDFVIKRKEALSTRIIKGGLHLGIRTGPRSLRSFGIIYGEAKKGRKAYNWHLTHDMCSLAFFDAQIGEYSLAALDKFGFELTFITF